MGQGGAPQLGARRCTCPWKIKINHLLFQLYLPLSYSTDLLMLSLAISIISFNDSKICYKDEF